MKEDEGFKKMKEWVWERDVFDVVETKFLINFKDNKL